MGQVKGYIPYRKSDLIKLHGKDKAESIVKNREWHSNQKINEDYKQEIWGTNLSKYAYSKADSYVWYGTHLAGYIDPKFFNQKRVLVREITNPQIIASIIEEELVNDPQIISIIPKGGSSIEIIWAILNSQLATFYHFNSSPKATKGAFPKILVGDIKSFPIPEISKQDKEKIEELAIKAFENQSESKKLISLEEELEKMIFKIYGLNKSDIDLITTFFKKDI